MGAWLGYLYLLVLFFNKLWFLFAWSYPEIYISRCFNKTFRPKVKRPPVHVTHPRRSRFNILSFQLKLNLCPNVLFIMWAELLNRCYFTITTNPTSKSDHKARAFNFLRLVFIGRSFTFEALRHLVFEQCVENHQVFRHGSCFEVNKVEKVSK